MEKDLLEVTGRVFNIQRFSIHDGPGVRTIVFLKGCPLRCRWCCNPESQEWDIQSINIGGKAKTVGRDVTVGEIMTEVEKDRTYYRRSGGGMTLSGGECLWQPEFSYALLKSAKENGINTAIETTGYASPETVLKIIENVDTVLMDIKHINGEKHKEFTGRDNSLILENAALIAKNAERLIVRTPVIPTFNDTEKDISDIADFALSLGTVKEMHLLPYHRIGSDKYAGLGRPYTMSHIEVPTAEKMKTLLKAAESRGIKAQIGG